jgi:Siphovirus Gp157
MNLYEIAVEGAEMEQMLEETGGVLTPELEARFDALLKGGKEKIEAALCVRQNMKAEAKAAKEEATRLAGRAASLEKQVAKLSERVLIAVDWAFDGKIKTPRFTAYGTTGADGYEYTLAPDCDIVELHKANPEIVRMNVELNRAALNQLVKDGEALPQEIHVEPVPGKRWLNVR